PRWPRGKILALGPEVPRFETRFLECNPLYMGLVSSHTAGQAKLKGGMPAQMSFSSSNQG
ncbi:hypothetical protein AVEN_53864-1, partial [Araneus ventricosus]